MKEEDSERMYRARGADVELNALEIRSVKMTDEGCKLRMRIDSCMPLTVFLKTVAERTHDMTD